MYFYSISFVAHYPQLINFNSKKTANLLYFAKNNAIFPKIFQEDAFDVFLK